jgi:cytochrome c553
MIFPLALLALAAGPVQADEGDAERGRNLAETCAGCHGVAGYTNAYPTYKVPKIGGQHIRYLVAALEAYSEGERQHPTMRGQSRGLSEQDIRDISTYLAETGLEAPRAYGRARGIGNPNRGRELAGDRGCAACHGSDGLSPEGMQPPSPILAGQYADYLYQSMKQYKNGTRDNAIMGAQVGNLNDRDMRDLAAFYASEKGPLKVMPRH